MNKDEVPPPVWVDIRAHYACEYKNSDASEPYVPATELDRVWEKAIGIANGWATSPSCSEEHTDNPCCHVRTGAGIAAALERARDESEKQ